MMNVYDKINELAKTIKESKEFTEYTEIKSKVFEIEENKKLVKDFKTKQMEIQKLAMEGKESESEEKYRILQQMYTILLDNQEIKKMFDAEVRFDILIGDMYRILGEAIKEAMDD